MDTSSNVLGRRRNNSRVNAEDQALDQIAKEAEARLATRRQARAEAREVRIRELERQQKKLEQNADRVFDMHSGAGIDSLSRSRLVAGMGGSPVTRASSMSSRRSSEDSLEEEGRSLRDMRHELKDVEDRFRKVMIANAQLDNECASKTYQIQMLKDKLEEICESYAQLQREFKDKTRDYSALKRNLDKFNEELKLIQGQLEERDKLIQEQGLLIVSVENVDGTDAKRALVTVDNAQLLGSVQGSLDVRLKKFSEEKQQLLVEVQNLQEQLEAYKIRGGKSNSINGPAGIDDDDYDAQREANKIISDYKYKLQKAEQEVASLQASLARSETQVIRYKSTAEAAEKAEAELKIERRKLQRENREAMERLEELETSNNHLLKRLDKLKNAKPHISIPKHERALLNTITEDDLRGFVEQGTESVRKELRLEENLLNSAIAVQNGSLSHNQLLETLPSDKAKEDSEVAMRILRSSMYAYNSKCIEHDISGTNCRAFLSEKSIPKSTALWEDCTKILQGQREGHHELRRLLPSNYQDGFYRMFTEIKLPSARKVSSSTLHGQSTNVMIGNEALDESLRNLALVQWAQFIEHDISKPVATSMKNGEPIECCNNENYKLAPRYQHPACAPLMDKNHLHKHGRETCLNYVRSALAVGSACNFGGADQLNQATGYLDLSQLYGYTSDEEQLMRTHRFGQIKSSQTTSNPTEHLLPLATTMPHTYCSLKLGAQNESCFMAGDSRVNSNPFSIVLYTIFMRSHNRIANDLNMQHSEWNDDHLYKMAKSMNIDLYRRIVFKEWLPAVLGQQLADQINAETLQRDVSISSLKISNEFAVAAIRFYHSMMPNVLHDLAERSPTESDRTTITPIDNNDISPSPNIFVLDEQMYRSGVLTSSSNKLSNILESILHQRAMKMDGHYAETFLENFMGANHPRHTDALAFDIQRGRDHGLQGYVKYLELCQGITIKEWNDLNNYIDVNDIEKLRTAYDSPNDVDLIVGGISEKPVNGSTVGPTFTCILAEQFSKIYQWHQLLNHQSKLYLPDSLSYENWTGAELLCATSQLRNVQTNIFKIASDLNPLVRCGVLLRTKGPVGR